jgi:hypothetical protein
VGPVERLVDVRFGSKADIDPLSPHVRFSPKSGHQNQPALNAWRSSSGSLASKDFNKSPLFPL